MSLPKEIFTGLMIATIFAACNSNNHQTLQSMTTEDSISTNYKKMDSLLQSREFAQKMAIHLSEAYSRGTGEKTLPLYIPADDTAVTKKSFREEKIAINLAGFYALECGLNYLCSLDSSAPSQWLSLIVSGEISKDKNAVEVLNRFANATWKAGQLFRSPERIKKANFIGWDQLSPEEKAKDFKQINGAAVLLKPLIHGSKNEQFGQLKNLLQDQQFAENMASHMEAAYYAGENKPAPPFISKDEENVTVEKSVKVEKTAVNAAGFYALECGLNYLVSSQKLSPVNVLNSIINGNINPQNKQLLCRFANATWKAGQPFRTLSRIARPTFIPFNFLSDADIEKDWVQIKAAAELLLQELK